MSTTDWRTAERAGGVLASRRVGRWLRVAAPVAVALLASCVGPAKSFPTYESKAVKSVDDASSAVETVRFAIQQAAADRAYSPYLAVLAADAEEDVSTAQGHFDSIQPPNAAADALRKVATDLLSSASTQIVQARIAMRRSDIPTLQRLNRSLTTLSNSIDRFLDRHR